MSRADHLILCSASLFEDPTHAGPDALVEQLVAARRAGFVGISLWHLFLDQALRAGVSRARFLDPLAASGLEVPVVEAIMPWETAAERDALRDAESVFELAAEVGAQQVLVVSMSAPPLDPDFAVTRYRSICDVAADYGVGAMIEFLPWSGIPDLATAWQIVDHADHARAGLMIDTWHWQRQPGGPALDLLRTLPGEKIPVVQLCDSAACSDVGALEEAMTGRLLPGDGIIDFIALFEVLTAIDADPIFAPEVFNATLAAGGMESMAHQVFDASHRILRSGLGRPAPAPGP